MFILGGDSLLLAFLLRRGSVSVREKEIEESRLELFSENESYEDGVESSIEESPKDSVESSIEERHEDSVQSSIEECKPAPSISVEEKDYLRSLKENPKNMTMNANFSVALERNWEKINVNVDLLGQFADVDGYAQATYKVKRNGFPLMKKKMQGWYVDGTVYDSTCMEKAETSWKRFCLSKGVYIVAEWLPLHYLSRQVFQKPDYKRQGEELVMDVEVDGSDAIIVLCQVANIFFDMSLEIERTHIDCRLHIAESGELERIDMHFQTKVTIDEKVYDCKINGDIELSMLGNTLVSPPKNADEYEEISI